MLKNLNSRSIAVIAEDGDVLVFCELVLAENFNVELFFASEFNSFLTKLETFNYIFIDMPSMRQMKRKGIWDSFFQRLQGRIFILTTQNDVYDFLDESKDCVDILPYPFTDRTVSAVLNKCKSRKENAVLNSEDVFPQPPEFRRLVGNSKKVAEIKQKILLVADVDVPLIFFGESGTGKTVTAQIVHKISRRRDKPFVVANMGNGNKELLESVLFGTVRGAFTDAKPRDGLFRIADGGTLFMDEIANLPLDAQAKLLRVIETGVFRPLGSDEEIQTDVRLIFATNADLKQMVKQGAFREDLFWRIFGFPIEVPPLRERAEDIPELTKSILNEMKSILNMDFKITNAALKKLCSGEWPGNFRQFRTCLMQAGILSRHTGIIDHEAIIF